MYSGQVSIVILCTMAKFLLSFQVRWLVSIVISCPLDRFPQSREISAVILCTLARFPLSFDVIWTGFYCHFMYSGQLSTVILCTLGRFLLSL